MRPEHRSNCRHMSGASTACLSLPLKVRSLSGPLFKVAAPKAPNIQPEAATFESVLWPFCHNVSVLDSFPLGTILLRLSHNFSVQHKTTLPKMRTGSSQGLASNRKLFPCTEFLQARVTSRFPASTMLHVICIVESVEQCT